MLSASDTLDSLIISGVDESVRSISWDFGTFLFCGAGSVTSMVFVAFLNVFPCRTQACIATENRRNFSRLKIDVIWVQAEFGAKVGDLSHFNQRSWLMLSKLPLSEQDQQNSLTGPLSKENYIPCCHLSSCFGNF